MEESYFLYFEEHDWAARAKGKFDLGYANNSIIYHKEGRSIGVGTVWTFVGSSIESRRVANPSRPSAPAPQHAHAGPP
jgi:GT2 family glycosyltransferase